MFRKSYTAAELRTIAGLTGSREGWDFSRMNTTHPPTPWQYTEVVRSYLRSTYSVVDIGTGGGERLLEFRDDAKSLLGIDIDGLMIQKAEENAAEVGAENVTFQTANAAEFRGHFDMAICRHAPFESDVIRELIPVGGIFITQQVGERDMANVRSAFNLETGNGPSIQPDMFSKAGFTVRRFDEYNAEYVIHDMESLVFWLQALDLAHSNFVGFDPSRDCQAINDLIATSVVDEGLVTNEHRYLLVATRSY